MGREPLLVYVSVFFIGYTVYFFTAASLVADCAAAAVAATVTIRVGFWTSNVTIEVMAVCMVTIK